MATYSINDPPTSNTDHVRLLVGDKGGIVAGVRTLNVSTCVFTNEEIDFFVSNVDTTVAKAIPWRAAADVLKAMLASFNAAGKGIARRKLSKLDVDYEGRGASRESIVGLIARYNARAQSYSLSRPKLFRVLGTRGAQAPLTSYPDGD